MGDIFYPAVIRDASLSVAVALTTESCRDAQTSHNLAATSSIALGRLLTATALTGLSHRSAGPLSLQVVCSGKLHQLFADVTATGAMRGYVRNTELALPPMPGESREGRRTIVPGVGQGQISMIRTLDNRDFTQSATELVSGEIDRDVENFLVTSDQIPTALVCDVLLDAKDVVYKAGGVLAQAMPGANLGRLEALRAHMLSGAFAEALRAERADAASILKAIAPEAVTAESPTPIVWKCRCSFERVLGALEMLGVVDLADMVEKHEEASVRCDFCNKQYRVPPEQVAGIYQARVHTKQN